MSGDIFGLWLSNRDIFDKLSDKTLKSKQDDIISFFGGFRVMFDLCMNDQYNLDLRKQQKLFKLLSSLITQQNNQSSVKIHDDNIHLTPLKFIQEKPKHLSMHNMHDICVSIVFTYLAPWDHFALQNTCKSLAIIGRRKESIQHHSVIGAFLQTEHKLPYIMTHLQSNDEHQWDKAHQSLCSLKDADEIKKIMHSGILPFVFRACLHSDKHLCVGFISILHLWFCHTNYPYHILIKYGVFKFIQTIVHYQNITVISKSFAMICALLKSHKTSVVAFNRMQIFPYLVNNMIRCKEDKVTQDSDIIQILLTFVSSKSFKWNHELNKVACDQIAKYLHPEWIKDIADDNDDADSDDDDMAQNNHYIKRIYELLDENATVCVDIKRYQEMASISDNISDFVRRLSNESHFISFIINQFDDNTDVAARLILIMLKNRNDNACLFDIRQQNHNRMIRKLIQSCYCSKSTKSMEACLELSSNTNVDDKVLLAQYGIVSAFQDFISYFKNSKTHSNLLCIVLETFEWYANDCGCRNIVCNQLRLGKGTKKYFLDSDTCSNDVKDTVKECKAIWL